MSNVASHAHTFYRQVARERRVWTVRDIGGFPAPKISEGKRAQPFWSSLSRARLIIANVPVYSGFEPHEISWETFRDRWLPGLKKDGILVGVNWSGDRAKGYDVESDQVLAAINAQIQKTSGTIPSDGGSSKT